MRKGNLERYIQIGREIHHDKYGYQWLIENEPKSINEKVNIECPIHGMFSMKLSNHIYNGQGCPYCAGKMKRTNEEFIALAEKACEGKNITFEDTEYINAHTEIIASCHNKDVFGHEHGKFSIIADRLLRGCGCPKCSRLHKPDMEELIAMFNEVHGVDRYDYSQMEELTGSMQQVITIICHEKDEWGNEHGPFKQTIQRHLEGRGCQACGGSRKLTKEEFELKARNVHHYRYSYDKFEYVNYNTPGWITCPTHGDFLQTPQDHLRGSGCPYCKNSQLEEKLELIFDDYDIYYEREVNFETLGRQMIDFYLPQKRLYIECQGEQHYRPRRFASSVTDEMAEEAYQQRVVLDKQKYDEVTDAGNMMIYYTDPSSFQNKNIDVFGGWYSDKKVFTVDEDLVSYVKTLPDFDYTPIETSDRRKKRTNERIKWDYDLCKKEASKYLTRNEFMVMNKPAYNMSRDNGWLDEFIPLVHRSKGYWTKERVLKTSKDCTSPRDFKRKFRGAYLAAEREGWLDELVYKEDDSN